MASIRDQLRRIDEERSEWVRVTSRPAPSDSSVKKVTYSKRYYVQVDMTVFYEMVNELSKTANRIAVLMLKDMNHFTNIFGGTYEEIQKELELSGRPVREAMVELQSVDFIRKYKNGRWMVNPAVSIGCSDDYFNKLQDQYTSLRPYTSKKERGVEDADRRGS